MTLRRRLTTLRARLLWGAALAMTCILLGAGALIYAFVHISLVAEFDRALESSTRSVAALIEDNGKEVHLESEAFTLSEFTRKKLPDYFAIWRADGSLLASSSAPGSATLPRGSGAVGHMAIEAMQLPDGQPGRRATINLLVSVEGPNGILSPGTRTVALTVARHSAEVDRKLAGLAWLLLGTVATAILTAMGTLLIVVRRGLRPLEALAARISSAGPDDLGERIELTDAPGELTPVVVRLNELLDRVQMTVVRERRFTADVAHELRTPLAGLEAILDVCAARRRPSEEYERTIEKCTRIVRAMHTMVENLMTLARADARQLSVELKPLKPAALIEEAWAVFEPAAEQKQFTAVLKVDPRLVVRTDAEKLRIVVNNLFDNALSHGMRGGWLRVQARQTAGASGEPRVELIFTNNGSRLTPEQASRAFDRFWRRDESRGGTGVHCGLGLSLCREIVTLLGGEIDATSEPGGMFTVRLSLPGAAAPPAPKPATARAARVITPAIGLVLFTWLSGCQTPMPAIDYDEVSARVPGDVEVRVEGREAEPIDADEGEPAMLTLAEAVRLTVLHDPKLQAALARLRMAEADSLQTRLLPNPVLSMSIRLSEGGADPIFDAALATDLMAILQRPRKISAADAKLRAAAAEVLTSVCDIVAEAQEAYYSAQALNDELAALDERHKLADRLVQLGQARLNAGEAASLDVIALQTQLMQLDVDLAEKRQDLVEARLNLARLIGRPSSAADWAISPWLALPSVASAERAWVERAMRERSELRAKQWEMAGLGEEVALARWAQWEGTEVGAQTEWDQKWSVGPQIAAPLPIFDWGQAKRDKASASLDEARHQTTLLQRQIVQEVRTQYTSYRATLANLAMARDQLLPLQERRAAQAEASYKAGETDIANLLLAEEDLLDVRVKVVDLQKKAALARVKLQRAVGGVGIAENLERTAAATTVPATTAPATQPAGAPHP
jgi:signal transduction histidine kinase/outer membrane protein TolC